MSFDWNSVAESDPDPPMAPVLLSIGFALMWPVLGWLLT